MDPITILTITSGALSIVETLAPTIEAMANRGEITPEQQAQVKARLDTLRSSAAFQGPEWVPSQAGGTEGAKDTKGQ